MPRVRVEWIFVAVVFLSVFKEEITADVLDLPEHLTQIDAENLDGHVELSTLDVLPTTASEQEHSTTHRTRKFLKWPSRRPTFKKHNGRDLTLKTNELSATAASEESFPKEMDSTTQSAETTPTKSHNRGSYRYIPPKSSALPTVRSSFTTTEQPLTILTTQTSNRDKFAVNPKFRKFLMRRKLESPSHSPENTKNETSLEPSLSSLGLKLETSEGIEDASKHQEKLLQKGDEIVELTKALLQSEQNDQAKFFNETGTEVDETLFESGNPAESDLFEIDQNYNKFLMTEEPLEKVTVLLPASFNVKDVEAKLDLEEGATLSNDRVNGEIKDILVTKTNNEISNFEATGTVAKPVDESIIENSADITTTTITATTEYDKLSHLHKLHNTRYRPWVRFAYNVNGNSRKYLNRTTTEHTTIQNDTEPEDSATIQPTENSVYEAPGNTANSVDEILVDNSADGTFPTTITTTEYDKLSHSHRFHKSAYHPRASFAYNVNENSGKYSNRTTAEHITVQNNSESEDSTTIQPTDISYNKATGNTANLVGEILIQDSAGETFTTITDLSHSHKSRYHPRANFANNISDNYRKHLNRTTTEHTAIQNNTKPEVSTIIQSTEKSYDEATGNTANSVDEILIDNSDDETSTTKITTITEYEELSHLHKLYKTRYHPRTRLAYNVNENSRKYLNRTITEHKAIQNNTEPEDSTTLQLTEKSYNETTGNTANSVDEIPIENSADERSTTTLTAPTEYDRLSISHKFHKSRYHPSSSFGYNVNENSKKYPNKTTAEHLTVQNNPESEDSTTIQPTENGYYEATGNTANLEGEVVIENSAGQTSTPITTTELSHSHNFHKSRYHPSVKFAHNISDNSRKHLNRTTTEHTEIQNNTEPEDSTRIPPTENISTDTSKAEHKIPHMRRYLNLKHKNFTSIHPAATSVEEKHTDIFESSTEIEQKLAIDMKSENAITTHFSENSANETSADEYIIKPNIIHIPKLLNMMTPKLITETHNMKNSLNESSSDEITTLPEHKIIHMQKYLSINPRYSTTIHPSKNRVNENFADENTMNISHTQHLYTKAKSLTPIHFTENDRSLEANIVPTAHKVVHMHKFLNPKHTNFSIILNTKKTEIDEIVHDLNEKPDEYSNYHTERTSTIPQEGQSTHNPKYSTIVEATEVVGRETTTNEYSVMNLDEISESNINILGSSQEYVRKTIFSPVLPGEKEEHTILQIVSDLVSIEETKSTWTENINTISSTSKALYSTKPTEIPHSKSQIEINQTPDYSNTIIEEVTNENTNTVQYYENTHVHQYLEDIESNSTESTEISTETFEDESVASSPTTTSEEKIISSTTYINEESTNDPEIPTDAQIPSQVLTETAATPTLLPIMTEVTNTPPYIDERTTTIIEADFSTRKDHSIESLINSSTKYLVSSTRTSTVTTSVPLHQQGKRSTSTIPRRKYLSRRFTTISPIITDEQSGQEQTVTESIVTSSAIHLRQSLNGTSILSSSPSTLAENTTFEDRYVGNEDVTSGSYLGDASTETFSLVTENANEPTDTTENSEEIITVDPAHWYGVDIDITTEESANEKGMDLYEILDADVEEEKIVVYSVKSETEDTTTYSIIQIEPIAENGGNLNDTSESEEIKELVVTVDPDDWYGVEYGTDNNEEAVEAVENIIIVNNGSKTETKQNITVDDEIRDTNEIMIEIDTRFGEAGNFTNQADSSTSVLNNVDDNTTKETTTTRVTLMIQHETTVDESLLLNKTADKNKNRILTQSGLREIHTDQHEDLHESIKIETAEAGNVSDIKQTIIPRLNDEIGSTTKKSPSLSPDVIRELFKASTPPPNALWTENITELSKLADTQVTITSITNKNGDISSDDALSKVSKTGDESTTVTEEFNLLSSNSSAIEVEKELERISSGIPNVDHLDVLSEFNITKLEEENGMSNTALEESTNSIPVTATVLSNVSASEVALKNTVEIAGTEDKQIELDNEQKKMLFEKLGEVSKLNEDIDNVGYGVQLNESDSVSLNNSSTMSGLDEEIIEDDEEMEEDDDDGSDYLDIYAINRTNDEVQDVQVSYVDKVQDVHEVSYVEKNIFGNAANFSVQLKMKQQTIQMPSDVDITEDPEHLVLNFTWPSSENTYNYSLSLQLNESAGRYVINKMHLNFEKDDLTPKESNEQQKDGSFVDSGEDIQVIFSNTDFLKYSKQKDEENLEDLQRAKKERQERVLYMEIILGAVIVVGVIALITYILLARRRKLKSPEVENKDVSSRL